MVTKNFKKVASLAAEKAGTFIQRSLGKIKDIRYKGEINVVTDVDKKAEELITGTIRRFFPSHNFLAEENKYAEKGSDFTWIIDPLDGTTNFLHSFPFYCVSIALEHKNRIVTGVVYDPARRELFWAEREKGAFLNGKRLRVSQVKEMKHAMLATGFAYNIKSATNNNIASFAKFLKASQAVRRAGSAALDMCYVACGRFDGFWERSLNPWDTAASLLIAEEAGGKVTKFDGSKYNIYDKEILVSNSLLHSQMVRILSE